MTQLDLGARSTRADVELRLPADGAYISVVRTTAAGLAARADFTIEDIEDLRMAVGEASAIVLPAAEPGSDLRCAFHLSPREMRVSLTVEASTTPTPDDNDFAWQVLTTLASTEIFTPPGFFTVSLTMTSAVTTTGS